VVGVLERWGSTVNRLTRKGDVTAEPIRLRRGKGEIKSFRRKSWTGGGEKSSLKGGTAKNRLNNRRKGGPSVYKRWVLILGRDCLQKKLMRKNCRVVFNKVGSVVVSGGPLRSLVRGGN